MPVVQPTPTPPDPMAPAPAPSQTAATPAPSPSPSAPPRRSPRLAGAAAANPDGLHTAHIEGESDVVRLFDLSRSASVPTPVVFSTEATPYRFHLLDERLDGPIVATVASRWFGRSVATYLTDSLMWTQDMFDFVSDFRNFITSERTVNVASEHSCGFTRASSYAHDADINDTVLDALLYQYITCDNMNEAEVVLLSENTITQEIESHKLLDLKTVPTEQHPYMIAAAAKELGDLIKIGTFDTEPQIPQGRKAVGSRIVFKIKYRANGEFDKYKARLVAKGFMQRLGFDFFSTFSPMATLTAVRVLFAVAVHYNLEVDHADIPQAFPNAKLSEDVWMQLPPGISVVKDGRQHKIVKLLRALYGLRQSPQAFNKELVRFLVGGESGIKFTQASAGTCLYHYVNPETKKFVLIASEVDDLIITGTDKEAIAKLRAGLVKRFKVDDTKWESLSSFLGINIIYNHRIGRMELDVEQKINKLFDDHKLLMNVRSSDVPISDSNLEVPESAAADYNATDKYIVQHYASIVGACIYMSVTVRSDICYAVGKCSRGMHNPQPCHVAMLKHLVGYLKKTKSYKLIYQRNGNASDNLFSDISKSDGALSFIATSDGSNVNALIGLSDANFANINDDKRKSISGYAFFVFGCCVCWRSKMQTITAGSTHEAELIAIALAANEGVWIRKLLIEIGFALNLPMVTNRPEHKGEKERYFLEEFGGDDEDSAPTEKYHLKPFPLFSDNLGSVQTVNNPDTSWRTRHLDVKYFKVRDYIRELKLIVSHIGTKNNVADFFTKALTWAHFNKFRTYLGISPA
jgi:hypothetical protein